MEFLGLKIPESTISMWGVIIIVAVQCYFWLHLQAFWSRQTLNDLGLNLAWIGLYPGFGARCISLGSISALPVFVTAYLASQSGWSQQGLFLWMLWAGGLVLTCKSVKLLKTLDAIS
jgi:hypothetical protein